MKIFLIGDIMKCEEFYRKVYDRWERIANMMRKDFGEKTSVHEIYENVFNQILLEYLLSMLRTDDPIEMRKYAELLFIWAMFPADRKSVPKICNEIRKYVKYVMQSDLDKEYETWVLM